MWRLWKVMFLVFWVFGIFGSPLRGPFPPSLCAAEAPPDAASQQLSNLLNEVRQKLEAGAQIDTQGVQSLKEKLNGISAPPGSPVQKKKEQLSELLSKLDRFKNPEAQGIILAAVDKISKGTQDEVTSDANKLEQALEISRLLGIQNKLLEQTNDKKLRDALNDAAKQILEQIKNSPGKDNDLLLDKLEKAVQEANNKKSPSDFASTLSEIYERLHLQPPKSLTDILGSAPNQSGAASGSEALKSFSSDAALAVAAASITNCKSVKVSWKPSPDLAGYTIYRDDNPLSGNALTNTPKDVDLTGSAEFEDSNLNEAGKYAYSIALKSDPTRMLDRQIFDPAACRAGIGNPGGKKKEEDKEGGIPKSAGKEGGKKGGKGGKGPGKPPAPPGGLGAIPSDMTPISSGTSGSAPPANGVSRGSPGTPPTESSPGAASNNPSPIQPAAGKKSPPTAVSAPSPKPIATPPPPPPAGQAKKTDNAAKGFPYLGEFWRAMKAKLFESTSPTPSAPASGRRFSDSPAEVSGQNNTETAKNKSEAGDSAKGTTGNPPTSDIIYNRNAPSSRDEQAPANRSDYWIQLGVVLGLLLAGPPLYGVITGKRRRS